MALYCVRSRGALTNQRIQYLIPWAREAEVYNKEAYDENLARRLWEWLEEQVKAL